MRFFYLLLVFISFLSVSTSANEEDLKSQLKLAEISKNYDQQYLILDKFQKLLSLR